MFTTLSHRFHTFSDTPDVILSEAFRQLVHLHGHLLDNMDYVGEEKILLVINNQGAGGVIHLLSAWIHIIFYV